MAALWSGQGTSAWGLSEPAREWEETQAAARVLGLQLESLELLRSGRTLEDMFEATTRDDEAALLVLDDAALEPHRQQIVDLATKSRLPTMYTRGEWVREGGLMAYGPR